MTLRRPLTTLLTYAAAGALLAGCGSSGSSASSTTPVAGGASSSPTTPTTTTSSASPSATSTSSGPFGAALPATGPRLRLSTFTVRAPAGWHVDHTFGSHVVFLDKGLAEIEVSDLSFPDVSLAAMARVARNGATFQHRPRIRRPVTIDGTAFYRLSGDVGGGVHLEEYGAVSRLRRMKLSFELVHGGAAERRLVSSVLATFRLR